jgi:ribonuclease E
MLPDIRAVIAAILAAVGLLMATLGIVATLRVAQQHQSDSLRADLATRGRSAPPANSELPAKSGERTILIVDTPGPHLATPVRSATTERAPAADSAPEPATPVPAIAVQAVAQEPPVAALPPAEVPRQTPPADTPKPVEAARAAPPATPPAETARTAPPAETTTPPAEPPIGGPLAEPPRRQASDAGENPSNARRTAAEKARKARAARIARERKAGKRAAQARRAQQPSPAFGGSNTFGNINQVGGTFRQ